MARKPVRSSRRRVRHNPTGGISESQVNGIVAGDARQLLSWSRQAERAKHVSRGEWDVLRTGLRRIEDFSSRLGKQAARGVHVNPKRDRRKRNPEARLIGRGYRVQELRDGKWVSQASFGTKANAETNAVYRRVRGRRARVVAANPGKARAMLAFTVKRGGHAVGKVVARTASAAAREAKAAGLELGRQVKAEYCRNPPRGAVLSKRAEALTYKHQDDGEWYRHKWAPGVVVKVSPNRKRVTLYRPDGKPVAGNFDVP